MKRLTFSDIAGLASMLLILVFARIAPAEQAEALRVATLLPFVESALRLEPERVEIVASVRRSMRTPLTGNIVDLGNPHSPNFERLAEARPDLIVGDMHVHAALAPRLQALGAEVRLIETTGIDQTLGALEDLAATAGKTETLDARIADVRSELKALKTDQPHKVLALFGAPGTFYAITDRAWLGQLVSELGFENLAPQQGDERFPGMVVVSDEIISTLSPDLVVIVAHGDPRAIRADLAERTQAGGAWSSLQRADRGIHVLSPTLFAANPGLDLSIAARELLSLLDAPLAADAGHAAPPSVSAGPSHR